MLLDSNAIPINSMQSISPMGGPWQTRCPLNLESRRESTLETNVSRGQMFFHQARSQPVFCQRGSGSRISVMRNACRAGGRCLTESQQNATRRVRLWRVCTNNGRKVMLPKIDSGRPDLVNINNRWIHPGFDGIEPAESGNRVSKDMTASR